jgi:hypothetical protein
VIEIEKVMSKKDKNVLNVLKDVNNANIFKKLSKI